MCNSGRTRGRDQDRTASFSRLARINDNETEYVDQNVREGQTLHFTRTYVADGGGNLRYQNMENPSNLPSASCWGQLGCSKSPTAGAGGSRGGSPQSAPSVSDPPPRPRRVRPKKIPANIQQARPARVARRVERPLHAAQQKYEFTFGKLHSQVVPHLTTTNSCCCLTS